MTDLSVVLLVSLAPYGPGTRRLVSDHSYRPRYLGNLLHHQPAAEACGVRGADTRGDNRDSYSASLESEVRWWIFCCGAFFTADISGPHTEVQGSAGGCLQNEVWGNFTSSLSVFTVAELPSGDTLVLLLTDGFLQSNIKVCYQSTIFQSVDFHFLAFSVCQCLSQSVLSLL